MDFIVKVKAQTLDSIAKASIPYAPPNTSITVFPTEISPTPDEIGPLIFLQPNKFQLSVNEKVLTKIRIDTKGEFIKSFSFTVKYNPEYFQIRDMDLSRENTQILYKDQFFNALTHEVDISSGTIFISAEAQDGTATISSRDVAEFELIALKEGVSSISLIVDGSSLVNQNNINILDLSQDQLTDIIISNTIVTLAPTTDNIGPTGELPKNGIFDSMGTTQAFLVGALLIGIGTYLYNIQRNATQKD